MQAQNGLTITSHAISTLDSLEILDHRNSGHQTNLIGGCDVCDSREDDVYAHLNDGFGFLIHNPRMRAPLFNQVKKELRFKQRI